MVAAAVVFGLSLTDALLLLAGCGYLVSLAKDWRPVRDLRRENGELRESLKSAQHRIDELESKVHDLEKATVPILQAELVHVAQILERAVETLDGFDKTLKANTAAVEFLSKRNVIDSALSEQGDQAA